MDKSAGKSKNRSGNKHSSQSYGNCGRKFCGKPTSCPGRQRVRAINSRCTANRRMGPQGRIERLSHRKELCHGTR